MWWPPRRVSKWSYFSICFYAALMKMSSKYFHQFGISLFWNCVEGFTWNISGKVQPSDDKNDADGCCMRPQWISIVIRPRYVTPWCGCIFWHGHYAFFKFLFVLGAEVWINSGHWRSEELKWRHPVFLWLEGARCVLVSPLQTVFPSRRGISCMYATSYSEIERYYSHLAWNIYSLHFTIKALFIVRRRQNEQKEKRQAGLSGSSEWIQSKHSVHNKLINGDLFLFNLPAL